MAPTSGIGPRLERKAAEALVASDGPWAERLLFDARQTDAALDASRQPTVSMALRDRVIASAMAAGLSPRKARVFWDRLVLWFGAGWAAAACAGVIAGASLTPHLTADAQADAVLYQSSLSGVDDTEVLG
jgi:hypothetical protein